MTELKPRYIVDENDRRVGALIDIETFEQIEEAIENRGLFLMMKETENDESLSLDEARAFYEELRSNDANRIQA